MQLQRKQEGLTAQGILPIVLNNIEKENTSLDCIIRYRYNDILLVGYKRLTYTENAY